MKKISIFIALIIFTACSNEATIINKGVDKKDFLKKANIIENAVSYEFCNGNIADNCTVNLLNDDTSYAYGFNISCTNPNAAYFNTQNAIQDFYPIETQKDGFNTIEIRYNRFLSDDITFEFIQFSAIAVPEYNNKLYLSLNNMCYEWDFSSSPYKFIK